MKKSTKGIMHLLLTIAVALIVYYLWQSGSAA